MSDISVLNQLDGNTSLSESEAEDLSGLAGRSQLIPNHWGYRPPRLPVQERLRPVRTTIRRDNRLVEARYFQHLTKLVS